MRLPKVFTHPVRTASVFASRKRCISFSTPRSSDWHFLVSPFSSETDVALLGADDEEEYSSVVELPGPLPLPLLRIDPSPDEVASIAAMRCAVRAN